jgi:hypothetical protein
MVARLHNHATIIEKVNECVGRRVSKNVIVYVRQDYTEAVLRCAFGSSI